MVRLSILIPTVPNRLHMLNRLMEKLKPQLEEGVEVLVSMDNKFRTLGAKRNHMLAQAIGEYVCFIDDDDLVSDDYVSRILKATEEGNDVICFDAIITTNGENPKRVVYSKDIEEGFDGTTYKRNPNQLMCFRKEIAIKAYYPDKSFGEDTEYAKKILPFLTSETRIGETLYFYEYRPGMSECK